MTLEELKKVPFRFRAHLAMAHEHTCTYESEDGRLAFCDHTPKREDGTFGRTYRHWRIDSRVYKSKQKFLEAIKEFDPNSEFDYGGITEITDKLRRAGR